ALRTDLSGDPSFRELLGRVRETALGAYEHQDLPFEKLVVELKPERNPSYTPIFQVLFSVGHVTSWTPHLPGLTLVPILIDLKVAKFDLSVGMNELPDGISIGVEYSTDLFDEASIERMIGHLRTLLEGAVADPDRRLTELPLLTEAEHHQTLIE